MNLYPNESPLHQAFTHVASHADRVWWNEKDYVDIYKMANLNLYKNILKLSNRPANNNSVDLLMNNLENEKIMSSSARAEQFFNWSFDACERRENSNNMMESYQALFELLKSKDAMESNNKPVLPYNMETMDDIILYSSLHQSSVKNLWAGEKSMQEVQADSSSGRTDELQVYDSELNANVPEFYPSVLVPPLQCPPRYPSIYDANYQNELFPFKDDNWSAAHPHSVNVLQNSEIVWSYEESQSGASGVTTQFLNGSSLPVEGSSSASASNLPTYTVSLSNSYSLAAADFPELPKTQDAAIDIIRKTNIWLEAAFPKKDQDFKKLTEVAAHLDSLIPQLTISQQGMICSQSKQPDRRLYRDVLAQKETEPEEKEDGGLEIKFEELEREALAQYRASETSLVPTVVTELSPELEENLEREALEQYSGDFHLELADEMLVQSKKCTAAAEDDSNEIKPTASTNFDRDEFEDVMDVKADSQEKCMPTEELTPQLQVRTLQQQLPAQIYQSKNKSRQRKGNKKKRGKWKGGGGSSALAVVSSTGPSEDGHFDSRGDNGSSDFKSESGLNMSDSDNKLGASTGTKSNYFTYCEEENKRLCTELKQKALNYLKGVDLNLTGEIKRYSNKNTIKQLLYKGALPVPIVQSVKLEEIEDAETYKQYAKEVTNSARTLLLSMFKRIRTELMDTTSTGNIIIVAPTTAEKRKVRHKIQKCVRLLERADHLKRVPRKPVESARNEVSETLKLLHRTMEVVYGLKEITRTAYENLEYLRKSNEILLDIYLATTFIKDKTEYIQQRIFNDARNILLVLLFPRREGYLLDRVTQRLIVHPEGEQIGYVHRCYITDTCDILTRGPNWELMSRCPYNDLVRIWNVFKYEHHKKKDLWSEENWEHWLTIGDRFFAKVDLTLYGDVNILLLMNLIKNLQELIGRRSIVKKRKC
ncbi:uncharacterized protein isoform X4 [Rhodnius prolixus]|uniref:uncharacterized protein isoform X4 n=1 Tax=Rhodnius prolixus TaxID=13249 RepID=UPI003D18DE90